MQDGGVLEYNIKIATEGDTRKDEKMGASQCVMRILASIQYSTCEGAFILILQMGCNIAWHGKLEHKYKPFAQTSIMQPKNDLINLKAYQYAPNYQRIVQQTIKKRRTMKHLGNSNKSVYIIEWHRNMITTKTKKKNKELTKQCEPTAIHVHCDTSF